MTNITLKLKIINAKAEIKNINENYNNSNEYC